MNTVPAVYQRRSLTALSFRTCHLECRISCLAAHSASRLFQFGGRFPVRFTRLNLCSSEVDQFVLLQDRERELGVPVVVCDRNALAGPDGARGMKVSLHAYLNVRHADRIEICGIRMARKIDELHQVAILLPHERYFDKRVRVALKLAAIGQHGVDQVA
jgi:hypothetical protein